MLREDSKLMTIGITVPGIRLQTNAHKTKSTELDKPQGPPNTGNDEVQHCSDLPPWFMPELIEKFGLARN